jgi:hypothetical protein
MSPSPSYVPVIAAGRDVAFSTVTVTGAATAQAFNTNSSVRSAFLKTTSDVEHAVTVYQAGTGTAPGAVALNVISDRPGDSTMYVTGHESGRGTIKIAHLNPGPAATTDANAAALSIDLQRNGQTGTAAQGIFITATDGGTTGRLLTLRNGGANLVTVPAAGSIYTATGAFGAVQPVNHGVAAWAFDPALATNSSLLTNGTVYLTKVHVPDDVSVTKLYWWVTTAGATPTAGQNEVGLYDSTGAKLASANVDADVSSTGLKTTTISQVNLTAGSWYWIAAVFNATTAPTVARSSGSAGIAAINLGLPASQFRFATNGTAQTVLPTTITPSANTAAGFAGPWAALGA